MYLVSIEKARSRGINKTGSGNGATVVKNFIEIKLSGLENWHDAGKGCFVSFQL